MAETFSLFGRDLFGHPVSPMEAGPLAREFILPPFSVLDTKSGAWQERKRAWIALGIRSEIGRGEVMDNSKSSVYNGRSEWSGYRGGGGRSNGAS